ncbi:serine hydrolase domain-containing protein [Streptomyces sp. NBC_00091]|uniref:serine hydrolase domain-containing protein n=1 Tax=Streptomyces sp. NBC_00091 TaxID=2975648 RepID=UPI002251FEE6|nr:serine hydrolase domain-containing protein [Streptomyces sp. NBC_00091]MCX5377662.1 beta-lactamase family protein [Streptomyces sp. NBC_00091]
MAETFGVCEQRFGAVREVLGRLLDGPDLGASVAVYVDGRQAVNLWGGYADPQRSRPWQEDTLVGVFSTTKTMTALCAHLLSDRGELDFHAPVARYWPEFAAAGKADTQVRHLMSHTAGLPSWQEPMDGEDLYDWEKATGLLAAQEPWWPAGTAFGYHAVTFGYLVGEVVRRISGDSLGTFFRKELAEPLDADFHIGLPAAEEPRVARHRVSPALAAVTDPPDLPPRLAAEAARLFGNPPLDFRRTDSAAFRAAEIPASNGVGTAAALAAVLSVLACGGESGGVRLMTPQAIGRVFEVPYEGPDRYGFMGRLRCGNGYLLRSPDQPFSPNAGACMWGGLGGSVAMADTDARMGFAYVTNTLNPGPVTGDDRSQELSAAVYAALAAG